MEGCHCTRTPTYCGHKANEPSLCINQNNYAVVPDTVAFTVSEHRNLNKRTVLPSTQGAALKSTISASTNSFIFSRTSQGGQSVSFSCNSLQLRSPGEMPCWRNAHHASPDLSRFLETHYSMSYVAWRTLFSWKCWKALRGLCVNTLLFFCSPQGMAYVFNHAEISHCNARLDTRYMSNRKKVVRKWLRQWFSQNLESEWTALGRGWFASVPRLS